MTPSVHKLSHRRGGTFDLQRTLPLLVKLMSSRDAEHWL